MEGKEPIVEPQDIKDAFDTIKAIELMGFALEETAYKPKFFEAIQRSMNILRNIHDDLVSRLPQDVIDAERAKTMPRPSRDATKIIRPDTVPPGQA